MKFASGNSRIVEEPGKLVANRIICRALPVGHNLEIRIVALLLECLKLILVGPSFRLEDVVGKFSAVSTGILG